MAVLGAAWRQNELVLPSARPRVRRVGLLLGLAALVVLPVLVYLPLLQPGRAPADFDAYTFIYPYRHALALAWEHGDPFPQWDPSIYLGVPFLADIQAAALYPLSLIFLIVRGPAAMDWSMVVTLMIAGPGMFFYGRRAAGLRLWGSLAAAVAYVLSSQMTVHLAQLNQSGTFCWTPWLMLVFDRAAARPGRRVAVAVAAVSALTVLAGHTQEAYLTFLCAGIAGLLRLGPSLRRGRWGRSAAALLTWAGGVVLGACLSAAQLLPTLQLVDFSFRQGGLTLLEANASSLPLRGVLGDLLPHYTAALAPEWTGACTGAVVLVLGGLALVGRWRRGAVLYWAAVALLAIWAATGSEGELFKVLFRFLPGMDLFRVPGRILLISTVGLALLAGHGLRTAQQLVVAARRRRWRGRVAATVGITGALVVAMALLTLAASGATVPLELRWLPEQVPAQDVYLFLAFGLGALALVAVAAGLRLLPSRPSAPIVAGVLGLTLAALLTADSWIATNTYHTRLTVPASLYTTAGTAAQMLPRTPNARFISLVQAPDLNDYPSLWAAARPNLNIATGRLSADGYGGGLLPLGEYVSFRVPLLPPSSNATPDVADINATNRVWTPGWLWSAGVDGVLTNQGVDPNPPDCSACLVAVAHRGGYVLWQPARRDGALPSRAWVQAASGLDRRPARVVSDSGEQVVVQVGPGPAGKLILADTYFPGWQATVDGRQVPITRADGMLQQVPVTDGSHRIVFTYRSRPFDEGAVVAVLALLASLLLLLWPGRGRRTPAKPAAG
ncbi:MAG TPA: YfhO family protein [Candidatus Dormibacteraeota bacterium]|nr:YfhO family protein [Candidatus Dormibacteraeota bacterium]